MAEGKMLRQIRGYEIVSSRNESNEKDSDEEQIIAKILSIFSLMNY